MKYANKMMGIDALATSLFLSRCNVTNVEGERKDEIQLVYSSIDENMGAIDFVANDKDIIDYVVLISNISLSKMFFSGGSTEMRKTVYSSNSLDYSGFVEAKMVDKLGDTTKTLWSFR